METETNGKKERKKERMKKRQRKKERKKKETLLYLVFSKRPEL